MKKMLAGLALGTLIGCSSSPTSPLAVATGGAVAPGNDGSQFRLSDEVPGARTRTQGGDVAVAPASASVVAARGAVRGVCIAGRGCNVNGWVIDRERASAPLAPAPGRSDSARGNLAILPDRVSDEYFVSDEARWMSRFER